MATGKRYYWIKLKVNFMTSETVDFLMSQENGAEYVVLYQMLCLKTINTGGKLERHIGEIIIPYDEAKIQRDCKWFSIDTVRVALTLYKKLGLIYTDNDGALCLTGHEELIGSETDYSWQKRRQRQKELPDVDIVHTEVHTGVHTDGVEIVHTEIENRDKEIENRDKDNILEPSDEGSCRSSDRQTVISAWNGLGLSKITKITPTSTRGKMLHARIREYGLDKVLEAISQIPKSSFLRGQNKNGWTITLDWLVKPNNFCKVLEGQYLDNKQESSRRWDSTVDRIARLTEEGAFDE